MIYNGSMLIRVGYIAFNDMYKLQFTGHLERRLFFEIIGFGSAIRASSIAFALHDNSSTR